LLPLFCLYNSEGTHILKTRPRSDSMGAEGRFSGGIVYVA